MADLVVMPAVTLGSGLVVQPSAVAPLQPATTTTMGTVTLAGDLGGTAAAPTVPALTGIRLSIGRSIADYPRVGGETDDMPRFRRALTDLGVAGGGRLVVPWVSGGYTFAFIPGSTILSPTRILITSSDVEIVGVGGPTITMTGLTTAYLSSIDDYASSGRDIFTAFSFAGVNNGRISGIKFIGEYADQSAFRYQSPRSIAVGFKGCTNSTANNLTGSNILGNLVNVVGSNNVYDVAFAYSENVTVENCHAFDCLENGIDYMGGTQNCVVSTVTAKGCANGIEMACNGGTLDGLVLVGNRSSNLALAGSNITVNGPVLTGATGMVNGAPSPDTGFGVVITGGSNIQMNGGKFNDNNAAGIYIYPGVTDVSFTQPDIERNALNATYKVAILMTGTTSSRIQRVEFLGGTIVCEGPVTGGIPNFTDDVHISNMRGTFATAASSFSFASGSNGTVVSRNLFNKPVSMSDLTGVASDNGTYRRTDRSSVPSTGSWVSGDTVTSTLFSQGAIAEWLCLASGTFGTLNGSATTGSITTGTTALTVSSATGLYRGAWLTVTGVSGVKKVLDVTGTTVTVDTAADATVAGAAIAYRTPTFIPSRQYGPKTSIAANPDYLGSMAVVGGQAYIATSTSSPAGWKQVTV